MKYLIFILLFVFASCAREIKDNDLKVGVGASTNVNIEASIGVANNPIIRYDVADGKWKFSNDGLVFDEIGAPGGSLSINSFTEKVTPVDDDILVIEDSADSFSKKKLKISSLPVPPALDINSFTEKVTPVDDDILVIEDSADSFSKKKLKISSLPSGGGGGLPENAIQITDWNDADVNGFFQGTPGTTNAPTSDRWWIGYVVRHNDRWITQEVWDFVTATNEQTRWRRRSVDSGGVRTWQAWTRAGSIIQTQFTSGSGTYTVPAGTYALVVEGVGGGGGGGRGGASGGSGGNYFRYIINSPASSYSYTIGGGGAGRTGSSGTGSNGGSTTCIPGGSVIGGAGGIVVSDVAIGVLTNDVFSSSGYVGVTGSPSDAFRQHNVGSGATFQTSGSGGGSYFGPGQLHVGGSSGNRAGLNAFVGSGGGGSGGTGTGNGGNGGSGRCVYTAYIRN